MYLTTDPRLMSSTTFYQNRTSLVYQTREVLLFSACLSAHTACFFEKMSYCRSIPGKMSVPDIRRGWCLWVIWTSGIAASRRKNRARRHSWTPSGSIRLLRGGQRFITSFDWMESCCKPPEKDNIALNRKLSDVCILDFSPLQIPICRSRNSAIIPCIDTIRHRF